MESALRAGSGAPGLILIETMFWDGRAIPRLALHLARLTRSAAALGWPLVLTEVDRALQTIAATETARLRLTMTARGEIAVETAPLPPAKPIWRVGLAQARLQSDDPWLRHKTNRRAQYDGARATLPPGIDEVVFRNERDEVCDGTITSVFFDRGQGMRTPPLASGLLPGVLRADLGVPEEVLLVDDLPRVRLWVGNALRGLIAAEWAGG